LRQHRRTRIFMSSGNRSHWFYKGNVNSTVTRRPNEPLTRRNRIARPTSGCARVTRGPPITDSKERPPREPVFLCCAGQMSTSPKADIATCYSRMSAFGRRADFFGGKRRSRQGEWWVL
jgi:hypothetical protein